MKTNHKVFSSIFMIKFIFILLFMTPFLMALSRNIATVIFILITAIGAVLCLKDIRRERWAFFTTRLNVANYKYLFLSVVLILTYMGLSLLWSDAPQRGLSIYTHLLGNAVLLLIAVLGMGHTAHSLKLKGFKVYPYLPYIALSLALVLIWIELHYDAPIRQFLGGSDGDFRMNRAAVAVTLFLPLVFFCLPRTMLSVVLAIVLSLFTAFVIFLSVSETAKLILVALPIMALLCWTLSTERVVLWIGSLVLLSVIAIPLILPYIIDFVPTFLQQNMPYGTFGIRIQIWEHHARLFSENLWFGNGLQSSYVAAQIYGHKVPNPEFLNSAHPHNISIQIWYELGLIGVVLFSVLLLALFQQVNRIPKPKQRPIFVTFLLVWLVFLVSHGAWQAWWWGLLGVLTIGWIYVQPAQK